MRKGNEILDSLIGRKLVDGIFQSYLFNGVLSNRVNVTYIKFDRWIHIATTDDTAVLEVSQDFPEKIKSWTNDDSSTVEFPLTKIENEFPEFSNLIGKALIRYSELVFPSIGYRDETCGLRLFFEGELSLILYSDSDENSYFVFDNGIPADLIEKG